MDKVNIIEEADENYVGNNIHPENDDLEERQSQQPEIPDFIQPKDIDEYFKNKKEFDDIGWTGQYSLCNKDILDFIIDFKLKKYYEV